MLAKISKYLLTVALLVGGVSAQAEDLSASIYNVELSADSLNTVQEVFLQEGQVMDPAYINTTVDPNLSFVDTGDLSLTFVTEGAGYLNTFGYFTYDIDAEGNVTVYDEVTIFTNASAVGSGGELQTGDTVDLGTFEAGDNVGFFLTADGANGGTNTYYSIDSLNPDGIRHIAIATDPVTEEIYIGFEDLYGGGDQDYNDLVFTVTATPYAAVDTSGIPTGSPEASSITTFAIALMLLFGQTIARIRLELPRPIFRPASLA